MGSNDEDAERILTIALLKSFRALELFAAAAVLGAIIGALSNAQALTLVTACAVCIVGLFTLYMGLRMRLDAKLFEQWQQLDVEKLDTALHKMNPGFKAGRSLELRLAGARALFKKGIKLIILQALLVLFMIGSCAL